MRAQTSVHVLLALALLALALPSVAAGQSFEGTLRHRAVNLTPQQVATLAGIEVETGPAPEMLFELSFDQLTSTGAESRPTAHSFKGQRIRVDLPPAYLLIGATGGPITVVNPQMGSSAVVSRETFDAMSGGPRRPEAERGPVSVRELGAAVINGIETIGFEATDGESVLRGWIAPSRLPAARAMLSVFSMMSAEPVPGLSPINPPFDRGLVIRTQLLYRSRAESRAGPGWRFVVNELVAIEPPPDDSAFVVPAELPVTDMVDSRPFAFEGTITQRVTFLGPDQIATVTHQAPGTRPDPEQLFGETTAALVIGSSRQARISFKRAQIRLDPPPQAAMILRSDGVYGLYDVGSGQMRIVLPDQKRVWIVPPEMTRPMLGMFGAAALPDDSALVVRELGGATTDGVATTVFEGSKDDQLLIRVWIAPLHESAASAWHLLASALGGSRIAGQAPGPFPRDRGLPVRVAAVSRIPDNAPEFFGRGWTFSLVELTSIEEKPLDATLFDMPEGFEIIEMPPLR